MALSIKEKELPIAKQGRWQKVSQPQTPPIFRRKSTGYLLPTYLAKHVFPITPQAYQSMQPSHSERFKQKPPIRSTFSCIYLVLYLKQVANQAKTISPECFSYPSSSNGTPSLLFHHFMLVASWQTPKSDTYLPTLFTHCSFLGSGEWKNRKYKETKHLNSNPKKTEFVFRPLSPT